MMLKLKLKKGKERAIEQRHHWVYSGAAAHSLAFAEGDLAEIFSHEGKKLGIAALSANRSILGHMLAFGEESVQEALSNRIREALFLRKKWVSQETTAVRLINAEGDGIPGLIVDSYQDVLVAQISNVGIERLKPFIFDLLLQEIRPKSFFEKSTSFMRQKEKLEAKKEHIFGDPNPEVEVLENGLKFFVNVLEGQKTGLFLDQREMRKLVRSISKNKKVLNCFSYTGGFSIAALAGGASFVTSVDSSAKCGPLIEKNLLLNGLGSHEFICEDVFDFLKEKELDHDLVILDPPAFVKKREDISRAFRAYKDLNRAVIEKMKAGSILLSASCSYHVDETLFQNILFRACKEAKRQGKIIQTHRRAIDHPISIFHPESSYLKSFSLYIY